MLRTLLVGILAVTAATACSSKGDAPAAQPGVAAGKVVELTGKVTATRGTEVRTLAAGGEISSDDVIDTAADSRVVILVAHNNARWDLGPNKHGKVGESLAWTAAKQDRPATAVIEESSTAGAHAEKSAATTGTTTPEATRERTEEKSADRPAAAPAAEPPAPMDDFQSKGGDPAPAAAAPSPPPPPPSGGRPESPRRKTEASSAPRPVVSPPPGPKMAQSMDEDENAPVEEAKSTRDSNTRAPAKSVAPTAPTPSRSLGVSAGGGAGAGSAAAVDPVRAVQTEIQQQFAKGRAAMRACFAATAPNVLIQITVTKGVYTITTVDAGATDKERACLATIAKSLSSSTKVDKPVYVKLTLAKP